MKKFTKFCIGTIIALGFVGAVLVGNGLCTVGWDGIADREEQEYNRRSRSAKLRIIEKL